MFVSELCKPLVVLLVSIALFDFSRMLVDDYYDDDDDDDNDYDNDGHDGDESG